MAADPYKYFRIEAAELHRDLAQGVLDLERGGGPPIVARLLRSAHTLKGAARVVKRTAIADHAHNLEEILGPFRESTESIPREAFERLFQLVDAMGEEVAGLAAPSSAETPPKKPHHRHATDDSLRTVRTDVGEMDALLDGLGEAHIQLDAVRRSQGALEHAGRLMDLLADQVASPRARMGSLASNAKIHSLAEELRSTFVALRRDLGSGVDLLDRELRQVRDVAEHMRLVPAGALFTALERAVRDVASAQDKSVVFEGRGGEIRLDAHVLSTVQGALAQLVRNAVAHGIETSAVRLASGKPSEGRVVLEVSRQGRRVVFACRDDGRGIDRDAVRRAAQRRGMLPADHADLDGRGLLDVLLRGRVSTSGTVTEVSGRGIGLDLLRVAAEKLGAEVSVRTEPGRGTTLSLVVPVSLASVPVLLVEAAGIRVSIPLDSVKETARIPRSDVARAADHESVLRGDEVVPLVSLARALVGHAEVRPLPVMTVVFVEAPSGTAAIAVDRLCGTATVIQRPLPAHAPTTAVVAGVSIDASGNPQLVLDPDGLVATARGARPPESPKTTRHRILVVDDSMTTRMLEQSILESAGYEVDTADSAEQALEKVRVVRYALFLVDVEMPGMDGFSFIEKTRADPELRMVPAILVTSRDEPESRARGHEVGAKGYIVKGEFDQNELLLQIRKLVSS